MNDDATTNDQNQAASVPPAPPVSDGQSQIPVSSENVAEPPPPMKVEEDPAAKAKAFLNENNKGKGLGGSPKGRGRMVATILGVLLLIGGVAAGVLLVRQNQNIGEKAAGQYCDDSGCDVGSAWPNSLGVNHYHCEKITSGGCPGPDSGISLTLEKFVQSASFSENCGSEQIDVQNSSGGTVEMKWKTYAQNCAGYCNNCNNNNQCVQDTGSLCTNQQNECSTNNDCSPSGGQCPNPVPSFTQICNEGGQTKSVTVNWGAVSGAQTYRVEIDEDTSFSSPVTVGNLTTTSYTFPNVNNTGAARYAHVQVQTSDNSCTAPSAYSTPPLTIPGISCSANNQNPTCTAFSIQTPSGPITLGGPSNNNGIQIGDVVTIAAAGSDTDGTVTHIDVYWAKAGIDYCANPSDWHLIQDVSSSSVNIQWDTSVLEGIVQPGESVYVIANIHDNGGGWCTGNPGGTCGLNISACPTCGGPILINTITPPPTTPPPPGETIGGLCLEIKAYVLTGPVEDPTSWVRVTANDLRNVSAGDDVYFTVAGLLTSSTGGTTSLVDMARFSVTETPSQEPTWITSTNIKPLPTGLGAPQGPDEYYYQYTIPEIQKAFAVRAQVHDPRNNNWF